MEFPEPIYNYEKDYEEHIKMLEMDPDYQQSIEKEEPSEHMKGSFKVAYDGKDPLSINMVKVEIKRGLYSGNVFYKMQVVEE